jgi:hypothetical protein
MRVPENLAPFIGAADRAFPACPSNGAVLLPRLFPVAYDSLRIALLIGAGQIEPRPAACKWVILASINPHGTTTLLHGLPRVHVARDRAFLFVAPLGFSEHGFSPFVEQLHRFVKTDCRCGTFDS